MSLNLMLCALAMVQRESPAFTEYVPSFGEATALDDDWLEVFFVSDFCVWVFGGLGLSRAVDGRTNFWPMRSLDVSDRPLALARDCQLMPYW